MVCGVSTSQRYAKFSANVSPASSPQAVNKSQSTASQSSDIQGELQKAADMLKSGLIDNDEYKALKSKIISKS